GFLTMLIREWIGKWISGLILGLGFLWILFDRDNQGWHDKLMSTYVIG
ncbi:MAG: RDD family protein, partial [Firmicutes bacterium]|nr:RDD family protein [Bacillota bacterium]